MMRSRFVRGLAIASLLALPVQFGSAVDCGRGSSYSKNFFGSLYTVTDCWCKNPCITWEAEGWFAQQWCDNAMNWALNDGECL